MAEPSSTSGWGKIVVYGFILWLVPFVVAFFLYTPEGTPRYSKDLFESVMMIVIVPLACLLAYRLFVSPARSPVSGLVVVIAWAAVSVALDLPTIVMTFDMTLSDYLIDVALSYLAIPAITIAIAKAVHAKGPV
ncbi:MAG: hypothetical protein FJX59_07245 [Alphaproteobacteria bacterium]|nr:hypothetical protein [Alphaproteobacteria bacterium]